MTVSGGLLEREVVAKVVLGKSHNPKVVIATQLGIHLKMYKSLLLLVDFCMRGNDESFSALRKFVLDINVSL